MLAPLLSAWVGLAAGPAPSGATACERVILTATVAADLSQVEGTVTCVGPAPGIAVATYPCLLTTDDALSDIERPWFYPRGFSPASMQLWQDGVPLTAAGAWQTLADVRDPAAPRRRTLAFTTSIPERNGLFGRRDATAFLLGGWHPIFGHVETPLAATPIEYAVTLPDGFAGFIGSTPVGRRSARLQRGRFVGVSLPILLSPGITVRRATATTLIVVPEKAPWERPRRTWTSPERSRETAGPSPALVDVSASRDEATLVEVAATLADGEAFAGRHGVAARPTLVVVAPLRKHLAEAFDGGLAVSDRAFHVPSVDALSVVGVPEELFARFHRIAIWRAQLAHLLLPHVRAREAAAAATPEATVAATLLPPALAADAVAAAWRDALVIERYGTAKYAPDYLEPIAVIPEIEALIFAPQVPFADAYFDAIDERTPGPPDLDAFTHDLPRGKLLYEKLEDELGAERARAIVAAYLEGDAPFLATVARLSDTSVAARLTQWLGPTPQIDYALTEATTGAAGVTVAITATGPDAGRLVEPLTVAIVDAAGVEHRATRLGPGPLTFAGVAGPPELTELDPDGRTVELVHAPGEAPRFNDRDPARWRFLLNNITGLVAVTNKKLSLSADFSLRRVHDLRYRFDFRTSYGPEAVDAAITATYGFGEAVTPLRLANRVGVGVTGARLLAETAESRPGYQGTVSAYFLRDTRASLVSSFAGEGFLARAALGVGRDTEGETYPYAQLSASAFRLFPLASYHAILARLRGDWTLGDPPPQMQLRLGGRYTAGRGYETDEALAERRVTASLEYRHAWIVDTRTDFFGAFLLTGIEGAVFADAVYLPVARPGCHRDLFYDVGYGLRFLVDIFSVSPSSLSVDVGVPLSRCGDENESGRAPVTIYLALVQSFLIF